MTKLTKTGQAPGPMEMHHHRAVLPAQKPATKVNRESGKTSVTTQVADPFDLFPEPEPDPFA